MGLFAGILAFILVMIIMAIGLLVYTISSAVSDVTDWADGNPEPDWCIGQTCTLNCAEYGQLTNNSDYYCVDDYGPGYKSTGEFSQETCAFGQGKTRCTRDAATAGTFWSKCMPWTSIDANASTCASEFGAGSRMVSKGRADCDAVSGKGVCSAPTGTTNPPQPACSQPGKPCMKNCVDQSKLPTMGDAWCVDDYGPGYEWSGLTQANSCVVGTHGQCRPNPAKNGTFWSQCKPWNEIDGSAALCAQEFGAGSKLVGKGRGKDPTCAEGWGKGVCSAPTGGPVTPQRACAAGSTCMKSCLTGNQINTDGDAFCTDDYNVGWYWNGKTDTTGCGAGLMKGQCSFDPNRVSDKFTGCADWASVRANASWWCPKDHPGTKLVGSGRFNCGSGFGKGVCK